MTTLFDKGVTPRYEFRTFGQHFDEQILLMQRLSERVPREFWERTSEEWYILSATNSTVNIKIRDQKLDTKILLETRDGLEQWRPDLKEDLPVSAEVLANIFSELQTDIPDLSLPRYRFDDLLRLVRIHPGLLAVHVFKQRFGYIINETLCETANVWVNGARVTTLSVEAETTVLVKKTLKELKLNHFENINYPNAIKRITGMIPEPLPL